MKKKLLPTSPTSAAKAGSENEAVIAALKALRHPKASAAQSSSALAARLKPRPFKSRAVSEVNSSLG